MAEKGSVKGKRISLVDRQNLRTDLKAKYEKGASVRDLAESIGRSYGFVHRLLGEAGTKMRSPHVRTQSARPNPTAAGNAHGLSRNTRTGS